MATVKLRKEPNQAVEFDEVEITFPIYLNSGSNREQVTTYCGDDQERVIHQEMEKIISPKKKIILTKMLRIETDGSGNKSRSIIEFSIQIREKADPEDRPEYYGLGTAPYDRPGTEKEFEDLAKRFMTFLREVGITEYTCT